ncbi:Delta-1-pyrroline-5-carboxylate dehydrogenase, mitochondrial [Geodia barretti]|nr:Delta-1-pyrroline-5-carboxylate dehydrogenase, mitochondrial [Geodia barretti]
MADLISTKYRYQVIATTMLGQGKTVLQAEIDSTCETIDFFRFAVKQGLDLQGQPSVHSPRIWNRLEYRALEGFIASISPFNFTAIGANLGATPTLMGNATLWKPSDTAMLSNWTMFKILREAGLPPGVVNFVPAPGPLFGDTVTDSPDLAGVSFTGSSTTFKHLWKLTGKKLDTYKTFPRIVGECGGKNYHFVHPSADVDNVVFCSVRGAFEYCGQKCSATSRMYVPESLWTEIRDKMVAITKEIRVGSPEDFRNFIAAVIDAKSFQKISGYLDYANSSDELTLLAGGSADDSVGYFVQPTIYQTTNPRNKLMQEEIFGPVLTVYVYPDSEAEEMLEVVNSTSVYGLTGAVFSNDRYFILKAMSVLRHSAGNFYINDKSTGSVVGQQPFGGSRGSGTNDKAGAVSYLQKWVSPMSVKEATAPCTEWSYPSVDQ